MSCTILNYQTISKLFKVDVNYRIRMFPFSDPENVPRQNSYCLLKQPLKKPVGSKLPILDLLYIPFSGSHRQEILLPTMSRSAILKRQYFIQLLITFTNENVALKKIREVKTKNERRKIEPFLNLELRNRISLFAIP